MVQYIVVGIIVALAACSSVWMLMPAAWRRAAAANLASRATRGGVRPQTVMRLQVRLERAGSCSDCSSCKGCASPRSASNAPR